MPVSNVDGTTNSSGNISYAIDLLLVFGEHREKMVFNVIYLESHNMILGHTWLKRHNPEINWATGRINLRRCLPTCQQRKHSLPALLPDDEEDELHFSEEPPTIRRVIAEEDDDRVSKACLPRAI